MWSVSGAKRHIAFNIDFRIHSVPLQSSSRCKLESCLDFFIKEEVLDGDEMPTCSKCKTRRKSTKSFTIQRFPKYLVIRKCALSLFECTLNLTRRCLMFECISAQT